MKYWQLLGSLAALYFSIKAFEEEKISWNVIAGLVFFLALMSKENAITYLAVVPLTYFVFTGTSFKKITFQTLPFIIGALVFLMIRGKVLGGNFGSEVSMELMNNPFLKIENGRWVHLGFSEKMSMIVFTLGKYLHCLLYTSPSPRDLSTSRMPSSA